MTVACRPIWNFDGSSTGQAPGDDSEVMLKPQAIYPDPFRGGDNILVICEEQEEDTQIQSCRGCVVSDV